MTAVALAVDVGGTKAEAALVSEDGTIVEGSRHRTPTGRASTGAAIGAAIADVARRALAAAAPGARIAGAGIGAAGPVDTRAGTTSPVNLPAAAGLPLVALVEPLLGGAPVRLALDGACLALAESWRGGATGARDSLAMVVSTGVGGGIISGGRLLVGRTGNAGHIGQLRLRGLPPGSGREVGTLESIAAGPPTVAWARRRGWVGSSGEELAQSYRSGDPVARDAVVRSAAAVGEAIASVATLLDLEVAVIAGGFSRVAADYIDLVRAGIDDTAMLAYARQVRVIASPMSSDAPLVGAAALILRPSAG